MDRNATEKKEHFCPCGDRVCPHNPNNEKGHCRTCDACIQKNLAFGEIPSCFFKKVDPDISSLREFTFAAFVKFYNEHTEQAGNTGAKPAENK